MLDAMLIAKGFGPVLLLCGLWGLFCAKNMQAYGESLKSSTAFFYYRAFLNALFGVFILNIATDWKMGIGVVVPAFGFFQVLRGVVGFFWPEFALKFSKGKFSPLFFYDCVFGALLTWYGYF